MAHNGSYKSESRREKAKRPRAFLIGVEVAGHDAVWSIDDSLEELAELARGADVDVVGSLSQKLHAAHPVHYLGTGKIEELTRLKEEVDFDIIICDDELSPGQERCLEKAVQVQVVDRSALILDIFARRARTHEGRLQVELARYEYMLPRLTRQWTHLSRQYGAIGARGGPGETQLEVDRRRIRERIRDVKRKIEAVRKHRALHRERRADAGIPVIALVGYTNAGKSTLMNALTGASVLVENQLFATLDPTTRRIRLPGGHQALITDTVGFIQKLPPSLVAAFRATLEELDSADVLLHVLDVAERVGYERGQTVSAVLSELGLSGKPLVTALNKVDLLSSEGDVAPLQLRKSITELEAAYPNAVAVSAATGHGLSELASKVEAVLMQAKAFAHPPVTDFPTRVSSAR